MYGFYYCLEEKFNFILYCLCYKRWEKICNLMLGILIYLNYIVYLLKICKY